MNLLSDPWIPTDQGQLTPTNTLLHAAEIRWPRADWNAMTYVFLSGLLQTAIVRDPSLCEDTNAGETYLVNPPPVDSWIEPFLPDFELYGDRGFMQVDVVSPHPIPDSAIVPNMPGKETIKKNADIFVHRSEMLSQLTDAERAIAIYTLGTCGWSAGGGFLKNSRGGNALTTLLVPEAPQRIWDTVWLNVLSAEQWEATYGETAFDRQRVFPWTDPSTRVAIKGKRPARPEERGHVHVYWQMPMRNQWRGDSLYHEKGGQNGGLSYAEDGWRHPFTAYRLDAGNHRPVSCNRNLGYQHWSPYLLGDQASLPVLNIWEHIANRRPDARLWLFGWVISQAEALTWVDVTTPAVLCAKEGFSQDVQQLLAQANAMNKRLYAALKKANITSRVSLYQATESDWYAFLHQAAKGNVGEDWSRILKRRALALYETAASGCEPLDYARGMSVLRKA